MRRYRIERDDRRIRHVNIARLDVGRDASLLQPLEKHLIKLAVTLSFAFKDAVLDFMLATRHHISLLLVKRFANDSLAGYSYIVLALDSRIDFLDFQLYPFLDFLELRVCFDQRRMLRSVFLAQLRNFLRGLNLLIAKSLYKNRTEDLGRRLQLTRVVSNGFDLLEPGFSFSALRLRLDELDTQISKLLGR